jgi:Cofactor assembly of complex C subunit B, CCB2/CCB4
MVQEGVLLAGTDMQRGFSRLDQAWLATIADKIDSTLDDNAFSVAGQGFGTAGKRSSGKLTSRNG